LKVTREKEEDRQVFLRIELEQNEVDKSLEQSYRRLVKQVKIPGFRPGKAPRAVLERYVGKDGLLTICGVDFNPLGSRLVVRPK